MQCLKDICTRNKTYFGLEESEHRLSSYSDIINQDLENGGNPEGVKLDGSFEKAKVKEEPQHFLFHQGEEPGYFNFPGKTYNFEPNSFYVFSNRNIFRRFCIWITESRIFKLGILFTNVFFILFLYIKLDINGKLVTFSPTQKQFFVGLP